MTTSKPYHGPNQPVAFSKPTIGPRVYLVEGGSGWPETFSRKLADQAAIDFLAPLVIEVVLQAFQQAMQLETRGETWGDIIGFLAKITQQSSNAIPEIVGVGFWGRFLLFEQQQGAN
jgi:hypothetical protein